MIPSSSNLWFTWFSTVVLLSFVFPFSVWRKCFSCKVFIHCFLVTCNLSDVSTPLGVGNFFSFWTKWFVYAVILKSLIVDEYLFSSTPNGVIFSFCCDSWNFFALYNVVGPFTSDWILPIVCWLIFSTFLVSQESKWSFNHLGPLF